MADNYLENKMEEHRRGADITYRRRLSPTGGRPGEVCLKIAPLRVLVTDGGTEAGAAIVRRLRSAGCRVAFAASDGRAGTRLAQESGSRFCPSSLGQGIIADLETAWGGVDVLVVIDGDCRPWISAAGLSRVIVAGDDPALPQLPAGETMTANAVCLRNISPDQAAHLCLLLCLDGSAFIDRQSFKFA